ncbi:uncharacterized protein TRIVIDRAFT_216595 [Trichoderma virens Gv29-8]|uniref:Uncharacterized protein n=1 Tax=Hypocrea virens (strain Gv29-8 / FGSC 10586) TaxID=413071 RepID=G9N2F0_HYPVG|nr:uncharacterized protein TRIVIDRAFT_216595 [Trichoderma virens Gv29-8]EHK19261.1 hypothetical protein TRIVIDRAFT_216595 [Trichoderma virens Gv29-8]UKZ49283.1 hypothetical protein TrVGV298_003528 [Trichoderma virens]UKZ75811.1 hypothetical protein TrVFT333_003505 [Trichoderma virens FT-333]
MVAITKILWLALTATAATATAIVRRDVITVQNDITQKIGPSWTTLNQDIAAFPESGSAGATTIQKDFTNAIAALDTTTSDIQSTGSFGIVSGTTILADIQQLVPTFLAVLVTLGAQESSWSSIEGGKSLILSQLQSSSAATSKFLDAVITAEPLLLKPGALAIKAQLTGAFTTAIAVYSV